MLSRKIFNKTAFLTLKYSKQSQLTISRIQGNLQKFIHHAKATTLLHNNIDEAWNILQAQCIPVNAAGGLIQKNSRYLFIYRNGFWDLPKGKHDFGELITETAIRECSEECALSVSKLKIHRHLPCTYHLYKIKSRVALKTTYWFEMEYNGSSKGKPQHAEGITEIQWFSKAQIKKHLPEMFPSVQELLKSCIL